MYLFFPWQVRAALEVPLQIKPWVTLRVLGFCVIHFVLNHSVICRMSVFHVGKSFLSNNASEFYWTHFTDDDSAFFKTLANHCMLFGKTLYSWSFTVCYGVISLRWTHWLVVSTRAVCLIILDNVFWLSLYQNAPKTGSYKIFRSYQSILQTYSYYILPNSKPNQLLRLKLISGFPKP